MFIQLDETNRKDIKMKVECNDPTKYVKNLFAAIKTTNMVSETTTIKSFWFKDFFEHHPEVQEKIVREMHMKLGLSINEINKQSIVNGSAALLTTYKKDQDIVLTLSTIVLTPETLFNYLTLAFESGLNAGKEKPMLVMNEPKTCK